MYRAKACGKTIAQISGYARARNGHTACPYCRHAFCHKTRAAASQVRRTPGGICCPAAYRPVSAAVVASVVGCFSGGGGGGWQGTTDRRRIQRRDDVRAECDRDRDGRAEARTARRGETRVRDAQTSGQVIISHLSNLAHLCCASVDLR